MPKDKGGPQAAYKRDGFGGVWRWAKGSLSRWKKALSWAERRKKKTPNEGFGKAAKAYAKKKHDWLKHHTDPKPKPKGYFLIIDGKQVPKWIGNIVLDVRKAGKWSGVIVSGYRSPEYSEQLCYAMCGAPSCPGRCAGRSSNHCCPPSFTGKAPEGAIDVSDYYTFASELVRLGHSDKLKNALGAADPVHFSRSGH